MGCLHGLPRPLRSTRQVGTASPPPPATGGSESRPNAAIPGREGPAQTSAKGLRMLEKARRLIAPSARSDVQPFMVMDVMAAAGRIEAAGGRVIHMEVGQPAAPAPSS